VGTRTYSGVLDPNGRLTADEADGRLRRPQPIGEALADGGDRAVQKSTHQNLPSFLPGNLDRVSYAPLRSPTTEEFLSVSAPPMRRSVDSRSTLS